MVTVFDPSRPVGRNVEAKRMAIPRILNDSVKISFRMERADRDYLDALAKRRSLSGRSEALRRMIAAMRLTETQRDSEKE